MRKLRNIHHGRIYGRDGKRGKGCRITRGNTRLHSHYGWITGQCEATHLIGMLTRLLRESRRFSLIRCTLLDFVFSFTQEEELEFLPAAKRNKHILPDIRPFQKETVDCYRKSHDGGFRNQYTDSKYPEGLDCDCPACQICQGSLSKTHRKRLSGRIHPNPDTGDPLRKSNPRKGISKTYSMELSYNRLLLISLWQYNHHEEEGLTLSLFEETFGKTQGSHCYDKWMNCFNPEPLGHDRLFQRRG